VLAIHGFFGLKEAQSPPAHALRRSKRSKRRLDSRSIIGLVELKEDGIKLAASKSVDQ